MPTRNKVSKTDLVSACSAYSRANRSRCRQDTVLVAMNEDFDQITAGQLLADASEFGRKNVCCQLNLFLLAFLHLDEVPW